MYADNTHLTYASKDTERTSNQSLASVSDWLKANRLS